jgi:predicted transcriptional regulator
MAKIDDTRPVTIQELLVSSLAQSDAIAKLLIENGVITEAELSHKIAQERSTYQKILNPIQH